MSDDLIKRSEAIKAMEQRYQDILRIFKRKVKDGEKAIALDMIGCIKSLPSADRPQGEWRAIDRTWGRENWICTHCSDVVVDMPTYKGIALYAYCPNCGAKMKGADDE